MESSNIIQTTNGTKEKLPGVGEMFWEAWDVLQARWILLLKIFSIPFILLIASIGASFFSVGFALFVSPLFLILAVLAVIIAGAAWVVAGVAATKAIAQPAENINISAGELLKESLSIFWSYLWVSILTGLVVLGGFTLFIIPGIIMAISLMFAKLVIVVEDARGFSALDRSRQYVQGYWWAVAGRVIAASLLIYIPLSILMRFIEFIIQNNLIANIASMILSFGAGVFIFIYTFVIYYHLRERFRVQNKAVASRKDVRWLTVLGVGVVTILLLSPLLIGGLISSQPAPVNLISDQEIKTGASSPLQQ